MRLRRKVKPPKRFDDESFNNPERKSDNPPPTPPPPPPPTPVNTRINPSLRPKIIEFNPNLPPAAFPTLDSWMPRKPEVNDLNPPSPSTLSSSTPPPPTLDPIPWPVHMKPKSLHDLFLPSNPSPSSQYMDGSDRVSERDHPPMTHPPNPMMTSEEAFTFEMQTSDEEEPSGKMPRKQRRTTITYTSQGNGANLGDGNSINCPNWEELSIAHQIDLVLVLSDLHGTTEHAMKKLRLSQDQTNSMLGLIEQRNAHDSTEKGQVDALQHRLNQILLHKDAVRHVSQETYRALASEYLYDHAKGEEYYLSTAAEFAKAARYLESCGCEPDKVLDHWHDEFGARAVSRFATAAQPSKVNRVRPEQVAHSEPEVVHPDTPSSPQSSTYMDSVLNKPVGFSGKKPARKNRRKPAPLLHGARRRSHHIKVQRKQAS